MIRPFLLSCVAISVASQPLTAQTFDELIARGDSLHDALQPGYALSAYRDALGIDSARYAALWRYAREHIDVAKQLTDQQTEMRDSLYRVARHFAEAAIAVDSLRPEGHFMRAQALGRLSRTKGGKERVRFAREIYDEAARTLELDPDHDGAHHVLGAWHAEVQRLSGLTKFFAKTFLGGGFMDRASWDSAVTHLERAVARRPEYLYHRLDLAQVYIDLERFDAAQHQLQRIGELAPTSDVMDPEYQEEAAELLARLRERETGSR